MAYSRRPAIKASSLQANLIDLSGPRPMAACPRCGRWFYLKRSAFPAHRAGDDGRCSGSAQRLLIDLQPGQWLARLRLAERDAGLRRGGGTRRSAKPPTPPPVCRIAVG